MFKRKRDGDEEADVLGSLPAKAFKYNPIPAPVQTPPDSEEEDSHSLRGVRPRPDGKFDRRILYVRAPRAKKNGGTARVAAAGEDVNEEDEEEFEVDGESDDDDDDDDDDEEDEDDDDDEEEEEDDGDGEEEGEDALIIPARLDDSEDDSDHIEVTEEALEHRLLGIGRQTKSVLPNQPSQPWPLSREREAALVALHVQPFANPNAFGFATSTGARKHTVPKGVSLDTSYTPNLERVIDNTGAQKGAWSTGVDPDTQYAGDVMLFPAADCVSKGINLDRVIIFTCDKEETFSDIEPRVELDHQPATRIEDEATSFRPALPSSIRGTPARSFPARRKVVRLAFSSLKTSNEPTFERGMILPLTKHDAFGTIPSSQNEPATLPLPAHPPPLDSTAPTAHPITHGNVSLPLQAIIQGSGIPRSLKELDVIVEGLAEGLGLAPEPSYLDMRDGRKFDLDKEMARYSLPFRGRRREPVDYTGRLLSLLNI